MISKITVFESDPIRKVMKVIDDSNGGVALMVDPVTSSLLRVITDGDIRRMLLMGCDSETLLEEIPPCKPVVVGRNTSMGEVRSLMIEHSIQHVPIVNARGVPLGLYRRAELEENVLLSPPHLGDDEMKYVSEAIESNWVAPFGPNLDMFEREFCERVKSGAAAAVSSGTAALHLALILSGVKPGCRVACSTFTFVASVNPVVYQGGDPVFIDSEPDGWNMCPKSLNLAFEDSERDGKPIKVVIVVNLYGQSARIDKIADLCNQYGAVLIEDSAESLGATYLGRSSGTFGKFGVFSFNGNKIITTSGGGMLVSDDVEAIAKAKFLATQAKEPVGFYEHRQLGYNYRLSNILAGIGRAQLSVLGDRVERRRKIFERYMAGLNGLGIDWMPEIQGGYSTRWLSVGCLPCACRSNTSELLDKLSRRGIEARRVWKPMHLQPVFEGCKYYSIRERDLAGSLFERGICLPSGSSLSEGQQNRVISEVWELIAST